MRKYLTLLGLAATLALSGCGGEQKPASPLETLKTYTKALKKKDTTTMKLLLSDETLKAHEQEAKAMGTTVDEIVKREALVSESQTSVEFRNEKIDGDRATLELKVFERWETIYFVLENGAWKIDKKGSADQLVRDVEEENRKADELNNTNSAPPVTNTNTFPPPIVTDSNPVPSPSPTNPGPMRERRMPKPAESPITEPTTRP